MTVLLPSILAAEAGGQGRFELEAETVGDALRALPVANMLFDERGELRRLVNVYVDGIDIRGGDGVDVAARGRRDAPRRSGSRRRLSRELGERSTGVFRGSSVALLLVETIAPSSASDASSHRPVRRSTSARRRSARARSSSCGR